MKVLHFNPKTESQRCWNKGGSKSQTGLNVERDLSQPYVNYIFPSLITFFIKLQDKKCCTNQIIEELFTQSTEQFLNNLGVYM